MTYIDQRRLTQADFQFNRDGIRRGWYSDAYFRNVMQVLSGAAAAGYRFSGSHARPLPVDPAEIAVGDLRVEAQIFMRRSPYAVIAGVDAALAYLRHATGYFDGDRFVDTSAELEVEAIHDGEIIPYGGDPQDVAPVLKIRGRYRDFALLETPMLGVLSRASRVATNCYDVLEVSRGKPVLFFPARFDLPSVQAIDGYAYWVAVQRYNHEYKQAVRPSVSTDAQGAWWGGQGVGTVPHALIAAFLSDAAETMVAFAQFTPPDVPRILLGDFNNDVVTDLRRTLAAYWPRYIAALHSGDADGQRRWTLNGVRLDTSPNVRDAALQPGDPGGVSPQLVWAVRRALDTAWESWDIPADQRETAQTYCKNVRIAVTGGFNRERIASYEAAGVPVDVYGVGSSLLRNDKDTNTDFTMDIVRVWVGGQWVEMAKVGRRPNANPLLRPVDLSQL